MPPDGGDVKKNFVLVDFENVQPKNMTLLNGGPFKVKVFLGASQKNIPLDMARALQELGADAEYIQIDGSGRNALDFHIAYYIGRLVAKDPEAHVYVVSKDTGFDPLLRHLAAEGISCGRVAGITDIPSVKAPKTKAPPERVETVVRDLAKRRTGKPRTLKTLGSSIKALFGNQLTEPEVKEILEQLAEIGVVKVADGKVSYHLPS